MKKAMKKRLLSLCAALAFVLCLFSGIQPVAADTDIQNIRDSLVVVTTWVMTDDGSEIWINRGTGFFVGEEGQDVQYLVTNHHVIEYYLSYGKGQSTKKIRVPLDKDQPLIGYLSGKMLVRVYYNTKDYEEAYIVGYAKRKDIAVLKLDNPTSERKPLKLCHPTDDMTASRVYCAGYPDQADNTAADATSAWKVSDATITDGVISRLLTTSGTGTRHIQTTAILLPGNSGGPMVNEKGNVIGVNTWFYNGEYENSYYAVNIDEVTPMLDKNGIKYEMEGDETSVPTPPDEEDTQPADDGADTDIGGEPDISDGAGANSSTDVDTDTDTGKTDAAASGSNTTLIIVLLVAVVVIVVIIVIVVLASKKKSKPTQQPMPPQPMPQQQPMQAQPAPQPAARVKNPVVRSLAAQHNGACYPLNGKQILIGRDISTCAVVFRDDTPGVSNRHCSVEYRPAEGEFIVTDLKSTYGTFRKNGEKFTPGVPYSFRPGEEFYLGGNTNMIRVELQ